MLTHFAFAFFCSIIFSLILTYFLKRKAPGPFGGVLYFFVIIFLFTMGLGVMVAPVGPMYKNVPWLSIAAIALVIMLLIAELLPHKDKGIIVKKNVLSEEEENQHTLEKEFGLILIIIAIIFIAAVIYALTSHPDTFKMTF